MPDPHAHEEVASVRDRRRAGWSEEIAVWDHWLTKRGFNWPEDYRRKTDPKARILIPRRFLPREATSLRRFLPGRRPRISILDVGSGPLSLVGTRLSGVEVELVPVDPLADEYNELLHRHGVIPPVRTRPCPAETVADVLGAARFDLVYCQNALDHTEDALGGLEQMVRAVKPGRWVVLKHVIDEGEHEGYGGLHDWNFRIEEGRFVIWNSETRINPDERLPLADDFEAELVDEDGYTWVRVGIRRGGG
jgi:SAM-dependent methyltransferase